VFLFFAAGFWLIVLAYCNVKVYNNVAVQITIICAGSFMLLVYAAGVSVPYN